MDGKDDDIGSVRHSPEFDTDSINRAVESASKDETFIDKAMNLVKGLSYPALKKDIIDYAKRDSSIYTQELVALFESLNGYIEYKDMYHLRKALEENNLEKKKSNQISQPAREQPTEPSRSASLDSVNRDINAKKEGIIPRFHLQQCQTLFATIVANNFRTKTI
jgi:hypothetical protein